ncbi:MAG TPA: LytTR family DNA-binding domain-containing protein [Longimicrobiaceae bacterium]
MLRVLVVDDEPLGRQRILDLLEDEPDIKVIGTAADGVAAVEAIRTGRPDLVFLDVQMPRMSGLDVVQAVGPAAMPATVFVTAHDQYALNAFNAAAVDYLVKPFKDDRFVEAVRRARRHVDAAGRERLHEQLLALLHGGAATAAAPPLLPDEPSRYLERIAVRMSGKTRVVPVGQIDYVTSDGPYAELHVGSDQYVIRESMHNLEERFDPEWFLRIHRSVIVQLDRVEVLLRSEGSKYHVQLKGGVRLRVGRSRREALERRLGKPQ